MIITAKQAWDKTLAKREKHKPYTTELDRINNLVLYAIEKEQTTTQFNIQDDSNEEYIMRKLAEIGYSVSRHNSVIEISWYKAE